MVEEEARSAQKRSPIIPPAPPLLSLPCNMTEWRRCAGTRGKQTLERLNVLVEAAPLLGLLEGVQARVLVDGPEDAGARRAHGPEPLNLRRCGAMHVVRDAKGKGDVWEYEARQDEGGRRVGG